MFRTLSCCCLAPRSSLKILKEKNPTSTYNSYKVMETYQRSRPVKVFTKSDEKEESFDILKLLSLDAWEL